MYNLNAFNLNIYHLIVEFGDISSVNKRNLLDKSLLLDYYVYENEILYK